MFLDSYKFHDFPNALGTMLFLPHSFNFVHLNSHAQNIMACKTNTKHKKNRHIKEHATKQTHWKECYQTYALRTRKNTLKLNWRLHAMKGKWNHRHLMKTTTIEKKKPYNILLLVQSTITTNYKITIIPYRWCSKLHFNHQNMCFLLAILNKPLLWVHVVDFNPYRKAMK